jgi:hypothetical protein
MDQHPDNQPDPNQPGVGGSAEPPPPHPAWNVSHEHGLAQDVDQYSCPEPGCDRVFTSPQGLGAHRQKIHGTAGTSDRAAARKKSTKSKKGAAKQQCPECGGLYAHLPRHMRNVHGGQNVQSSDLTVDDVFEATVKLLFPGGKVPVEALQALLTWRDQTSAMLDTVL